MTYSIIAHDAASGELGVAVQSHYFSVGSIVPWARPGIGAVATQANARVDYGPRGLELMASGSAAPAALAALREQDPGADARQVAMVDASGAVAGWTGPRCLAHAGDVQGDGVSCQANIMAREGVPEAMLDAFMWESGPLAQRMHAALLAAERAGGDLRGRQSVALLVVPGAGEPWETSVSLRVEDAPDPLGELERLLRLHAAYATASAADEAVATGDLDAAAASFRRAGELAPDQIELRFWGALGLAATGAQDEALAQLRELCAEDPAWRELLARLPADVSPVAAGLLKRLS